MKSNHRNYTRKNLIANKNYLFHGKNAVALHKQKQNVMASDQVYPRDKPRISWAYLDDVEAAKQFAKWTECVCAYEAVAVPPTMAAFLRHFHFIY